MGMELSDLEGVGEAKIARLKTIGIHTVEALAFVTATELEQIGILKEGPKIIQQAQEHILKQSYISAAQLLKARENVRKLTTGSNGLDALFKGGYETQGITEIYGEFGSGKSQLGFTAAVNVQLPEAQGGLDGGTLIVDSEETFKPERIVEIALARKLDPNKILSRIVTAPCFNSDHQQLIVDRADEVIKANGIRLIIVDSVMAHFRSEYQGREDLPTRQQRLNRHLHQILRLARAFNAVAIVTNQVIANPEGMYGPKWFPTGGHIMAHASGLRIALRKAGENKRIATITDSSWLPWSECPFQITASGVEDLAEEKKKEAPEKPK